MVLVLTCPELPPPPCPSICLFWLRSEVVGSSLGLALVSHALFHFLPIPFLALSGSACHVPSYWHRMWQCIIGNCQFSLFLASHLNHNLSILTLTNFSIHRSGLDISQGLSAVAKNQYDWSSEDLISSIKLGAPRHSPVDLGVAAGEDGREASPRFRVFFLGGGEIAPPRNRDFPDFFSENFPKLFFLIFPK